MKAYSIRFQNRKSDPTETAFTIFSERIQDVYSKIVNSYPNAVKIRIFEISESLCT